MRFSIGKNYYFLKTKTRSNSFTFLKKGVFFDEDDKNFLVEKGMRIAQMVICPVTISEIIEVDELSDTDRGENGFGSTGR